MGTCDEKNSADEAHTLKAQGNELFKVGDYVGALEKYTDALKCTDQDNDKAIVLNNRAAANIKLRRYDDAIKDASEGKRNSNLKDEEKKRYRCGIDVLT